MSLTISHIKDFPDQRWDDYVNRHPESTFFHLSTWATIINKAFGHKIYYLYASRNNEIQGILPLVHIKSFLFGNALISQPFCVYGGILANNMDVQAELEIAACDLANKLQVDYLEMRNQSHSQANWPVKDLYVTFRKEVSDDNEKNMSEIPRKQRAVIRKGIKSDLYVKSDENVDMFFDIYSESVRNHGTPVFSKKYFKLLKEYFGPKCKILFAYKKDKPISCVMSFYYKNVVMPYYGGGLPDARKYNSFDYMYWELMCESVKDGPIVFDYGRSKVGSGSYRFKKHWGFEASELSYQYFLVKDKTMPNVSPNNPKYEMLIKLWRQIPLPIANILGPVISKDLG